MHKIRNVLIMFIALISIFMARFLSEPYIELNNLKMAEKENSEVVQVGNFNNNSLNSINREEALKDNLNFSNMINGIIPVVMYLLSVLCLLDLIKATYIKFMKEDNLIYKTAFILLIVFQMIFIGLISFYVAEMSMKILLIWILLALILTRIIYEGSYFIDIVKASK
ncbi:MAG: hypothetical protein E6929_15350 [Clostridium sp.]|nr:hypothetical protein [Clostridium sp.]